MFAIILAFAKPKSTYEAVLDILLCTISIQGVLVVAVFVWLGVVADKKMNLVWKDHRARFFY